MAHEQRRIVLSASFLRRRDHIKAVFRMMDDYGLQPSDPLRDGRASPPSYDLFRAAGLQVDRAEFTDGLRGIADGYLAVADSAYFADPPIDQRLFESEFALATKAGLPIGVLLVAPPGSAPDANADLYRVEAKLQEIHQRERPVFINREVTRLAVIKASRDQYLSGMRDVLGSLCSILESGSRLDQRADHRELATALPDQSPAPVRIEERDGKISRISDRDSPIGVAERDFNDWREPVLDHIHEMLVGDFRLGTNHSRARDRLVALATFLSGSIAEIKERQFRIGYEIERFGGLVSAYRFGGADMPALNADVLEDLGHLHIALAIGIAKLERWAAFHRAATDDPSRDGDANPTVVGQGLNELAIEMERRPTYFDPELPETFRFLAEAARDPRGATRTVVYGGVRSAENLISFLGRKGLGIGANAVRGVEQHISKAVAASLIAALSGAALTISGALPHGWTWLKPLLDVLTKGGSG